jgi:hypothetical protein
MCREIRCLFDQHQQEFVAEGSKRDLVAVSQDLLGAGIEGQVFNAID